MPGTIYLLAGTIEECSSFRQAVHEKLLPGFRVSNLKDLQTLLFSGHHDGAKLFVTVTRCIFTLIFYSVRDQ